MPSHLQQNILTTDVTLLYISKNKQVVTNLQTNCKKSVHKLLTSCVHNAHSQCLFHKVETSLEQTVNIS